MKTTRTLAQAAILAAGLALAPLVAAVCPANSGLPFTAGPADPVSRFSQWLVDANGVALAMCTDSVDGQGNPPPCTFDPVAPNNPYSAALGRGNEAWYSLATNSFTTTGPAALDGVFVMGLESSFLSPAPVDGFQLQFSRLRLRLNVNATGIYTIEYPWGVKTYVIDTLLPPGNGQNRAEISDVLDVSFAAGSLVPGVVSPVLRWDPAVAPVAPAGYLGDGVTPHAVIGSPCGANHIRVTATALNGLTPIAIDPTDADGDGSSASYTSRLFIVSGKLAPDFVMPLAVDHAYYSRNDGGLSVSVMASSLPPAGVTATPGGPLAGDGNGRFFVTTPLPGDTPPATISVSAADPGEPSVITNVQPLVPLRDLVTISRAVATCSPVTRLCTLAVDAASSDVIGTPTLTLQHSGTPLVNGSVSLENATAIPGAVTVTSTAGGSATKPVIVINQ